jgi:hypothetical protein
MCLGYVVCCNEQDVYAADSFAYSIDFNDLDMKVDSIIGEPVVVRGPVVEEDFLTHIETSSTTAKKPEEEKFSLKCGFLFVKFESAKPTKQILSKNLSIVDYWAAVRDDDTRLTHDIAMHLLNKYEAMEDSEKKQLLKTFLISSTSQIVWIAKQNFQRDYILLWQAYVFYMKMVRHGGDKFFISSSQNAFALADVHGDQLRAAFAVELFLDKLTASFGAYPARQIIVSELHHDGYLRFKQKVVWLWESRHRPLHIPFSPPPTYEDALGTIGKSSNSTDSEQSFQDAQRLSQELSPRPFWSLCHAYESAPLSSFQEEAQSPFPQPSADGSTYDPEQSSQIEPEALDKSPESTNDSEKNAQEVQRPSPPPYQTAELTPPRPNPKRKR